MLVSEGRGEVVWDGDKGRIEIGKRMCFSLVQGPRLWLAEVVVLYQAFVEV